MMALYWIELCNMLLNFVIAGQLFFVMVWTYRIYAECFRRAGSESGEPTGRPPDRG